MYRVSPLSADIQSEINAFFEYAKEDEGECGARV